MHMKIGIAGTGRMGTAMAARLIECGHEVRVWNRTPAKAAEAIASGAVPVASLGALVDASEVVISSLLDNLAVERVYLGTEGLLTGHAEGRLFIDASTVSPDTHDRIAPAMASRGADFIECPVSGSIGTARAGALVGFAGGDPQAVARARPVLEALCRRVDHVGALGAGARMKLAANLLLCTFWKALGESLSLLEPSGIDARHAIDVLGDSNIAAGILKTRGGEIVDAFSAGTPRPAAFDVDTMRKDLRYMVDAATKDGGTLPLAARVLECFDRASANGGGHVDGVAYPAYWLSHRRHRGYPTQPGAACSS
jgi:3-hydroxyisobutyrate dehydrogenase